jgi:hypothetical protein
MNGRRLINSETNRERYELKANRSDLTLLVNGLKRAIVIGGLKYEDTFKYVSMVEDLISIRDGEIIDEI